MKYFLSCFIAMLSLTLSAHDTLSVKIDSDSVIVSKVSRLKFKLDNIGKTRLYQATYLGLPLIIGGLIEKHEDDKFRRMRNTYMPYFHYTYDNYTQYLSAAVMLGMKTAGVKSRSSWGRMLLSDAFSVAIMGAVINTLKTTTHVERPDGSNKHSFPSGHTATAFMTATMLSKEYGYLSPWVSVGAYSMATATGLMRMANNKHWLSDVMVGAGVGILSTKFGYWIADVISKDKRPAYDAVDYDVTGFSSPSFVGMYMGFNVPLSHYDVSETTYFNTSTGTTIGFEGAYFFSPYVGVGGRISASNISLIVNGVEAADNSSVFGSIYAGPYFSYPFTPRWNVMTKLLVGYTDYRHLNIDEYHLPGYGGICTGTGLSIGYRARKRLGADVFLDYNIIPPQSKKPGEYMHTLTLGGKVSLRF